MQKPTDRQKKSRQAKARHKLASTEVGEQREHRSQGLKLKHPGTQAAGEEAHTLAELAARWLTLSLTFSLPRYP
jgi:hypothetical protein